MVDKLALQVTNEPPLCRATTNQIADGPPLKFPRIWANPPPIRRRFFCRRHRFKAFGILSRSQAMVSEALAASRSMRLNPLIKLLYRISIIDGKAVAVQTRQD